MLDSSPVKKSDYLKYSFTQTAPSLEDKVRKKKNLKLHLLLDRKSMNSHFYYTILFTAVFTRSMIMFTKKILTKKIIKKKKSHWLQTVTWTYKAAHTVPGFIYINCTGSHSIYLK